MSDPDTDNLNAELVPRIQDTVRQTLREMFLGAIPASYEVGVVGTSEQEEQQMRKFDERAEHTPSEIVRDGVPTLPDWRSRMRSLPPNPAVYEQRYVLDTLFRFDTTITAGGTSATLLLPVIPQGKSALLDEIHVAQTSGAGSSPNGYLTDQGLAQLYAIITPDGSTFGASYKSGRNVVPGGIVPLLTLQSLVASATYLVGVQYQIRTKIDLPELDLTSVFGKKDVDVSISDDGFESHDVHTPNQIDSVTVWGGPYDFGGTLGDD